MSILESDNLDGFDRLMGEDCMVKMAERLVEKKKFDKYEIVKKIGEGMCQIK